MIIYVLCLLLFLILVYFANEIKCFCFHLNFWFNYSGGLMIVDYLVWILFFLYNKVLIIFNFMIWFIRLFSYSHRKIRFKKLYTVMMVIKFTNLTMIEPNFLFNNLITPITMIITISWITHWIWIQMYQEMIVWTEELLMIFLWRFRVTVFFFFYLLFSIHLVVPHCKFKFYLLYSNLWNKACIIINL